MSEATASTNMETASAPSDSGTGSSVEAGESEAPGAANENNPQAANDNTAVNTLSDDDGAQEGQIEAGMSGPAEVADQPGAGPAGDASTEATGDLPESSTLEAGEGGPPETDEERPADDTVPQADDSQITMADIRDLEPLKDDFNDAARKKDGDDDGDDDGDGKKKVEVPKDPRLIPRPDEPRPSPRRPSVPRP